MRAYIKVLCVCLVSLAAAFNLSNASAGQWWAKVGPSYIDFDEDVSLKQGGEKVPGANAHFSNSTSFAAEVGYSFNDNWSLGFTFGVPPTTKIYGRGSVEQIGKVGEVTYAPAALSVEYHFDTGTRLRPYVGVGAVFVYILKSKESTVDNLDADNAFGSLIKAGLEYPLTDRVGLFVDVQKMFIETTAKGNLMGAPVKADITLNPFITHAGVMFKF